MATTYQPRNPSATAVHQVVREHYGAFRAGVAAKGGRTPARVDRAMRRFLRCGSPAAGFARLRCDDCRGELLVPFSCKVRTLCASCDGRRMADQAARLCDEILPRQRVRQYVLTLPAALRYRVAFDPDLLSEVLGAWIGALTAWKRKRARAAGLRDARCAGFTGIQRFGDGLRLNPHFHTIFVDGVYVAVAGSERPRFVALPPPKQREVEALLARARRAILRRLQRLGLIHEIIDREPGLFDPIAEAEPVLAHCAAASLLDRVAVGERAGELVLRLQRTPPELRANGRLCATLDGISLHAATTVARHDRPRLERLCRYVLRPAIATRRTERLPDGRVVVHLKQRWADGTYAKVFEAPDLIAKLLALMPPQGKNLLRYHGQFAPSARWRAAIVPRRAAVEEASERDCGRGTAAGGADKERDNPHDDRERGTPLPRTRASRTWAILLQRTFAIDVLQCPCGGRRRLVALIENREAIAAILNHLGRPTDVPTFAAAQPPPLLHRLAEDDARRVVLDPEFEHE
jgi:hypothetical protein